VEVKIAVRHGTLSEANQATIRAKAEGLLHFFDRLTLIGVTVDFQKMPDHQCVVEIAVTTEHKRDGLVARESNSELMTAFNAALHKIEAQLRHYKEKIQDHRRNPSTGAVSGALQPESNTEE
jgi:putative sigma-54 modulation protein